MDDGLSALALAVRQYARSLYVGITAPAAVERAVRRALVDPLLDPWVGGEETPWEEREPIERLALKVYRYTRDHGQELGLPPAVLSVAVEAAERAMIRTLRAL